MIGGRFDIAGYLDHQGERFNERFDANSYLAIMRTMDTWDPLNGHASPQEVYGRIRARLIFIGISSDWLFPPDSVREFAEINQSAGCPCRIPRNGEFARTRCLSGRTGGTGPATPLALIDPSRHRL